MLRPLLQPLLRPLLRRIDESAPSGFVPSLNLNFLSGALDPRVTFTRASNATRVNSSGLIELVAVNEPRFDYDPVTLAPKGLLIEEQRTNLLTYSEQFDNAAWTKGSSTVAANQTIAPDGTISADTLTATGATGVVAQSVTFTAGSTLSISVFAKRNNVDFVRFRLAGTDTASAWFNLNTGAVGTINGTGTAITGVTGSSDGVGDGWYRIKVVVTTATITSLSVSLCPSQTNASNSVNTDSVHLWGAQDEVGAFPTSYIPTTSAAATRAADVAVMTGANFSSWYRQDEGTLFAEFDKANNTNSGRIATISNGISSNQIRINGSVGANIRPDWQVVDGGVVQANITDSAQGGVNAVIKSAGAYLVNSFALATNGTLGTTDTSGSVPAVSQANLGANEAGTGYLNGHILRIAYYPRRLSNAELQGITA